MQVDRRTAILAATAAALAFGAGTGAVAAPGDEEAIAAQVEAFRKAQIALDGAALDKLCAPELSYSHSDARVEDKAKFIAGATAAGRAKVISLEWKDRTIRVVGDTAIVRFNWHGESEALADAKRTKTNLHILMNWIRQGAEWKLLSRAPTRL